MGTWNVPDSPEKIEKARSLLKQLSSIEDELYHIAASDEIFDHLSEMQDEISDIIAYSEKMMEEEILVQETYELDSDAYEIFPLTVKDKEDMMSLLESDYFPFEGVWDKENGRFLIKKGPKYFPDVLEVLESYLTEGHINVEVNEVIMEQQNLSENNYEFTKCGIWVFPDDNSNKMKMDQLYFSENSPGQVDWDPEESGYYFYGDSVDIETLRHKIETNMDEFGLRGSLEIV